MVKTYYKIIVELFSQMDISSSLVTAFSVTATLITIFIAAFIFFWITNKVLVSIIHKVVENTKTEWDDFLLQRKVFRSLSHLTPAIIFYYSTNFSGIEQVHNFLRILTSVYFIAIGVMVLSGIIKAANDIYQTTPFAEHRSIKGYTQLLIILIYFIAGILVISILIQKSPVVLLTGLGAIAAVLLLVFKDTILGLVASIQLSGNEMIKPGDWIEMPSHNADGTVIDITLYTVKVQNWDKTITTIPTYSLVSESFNNWSGMEKSGGRRIKRSINIDMKSVRFCDKEMLGRFEKFSLIKDYVIEKEKEIFKFNKKEGISDDAPFNGRRQTNLGVFRKYLEAYLRKHPKIHQEMTFLVRHLQPTEKGLPIEIYVFSNDQVWANYEGIQADIFDHVIAVIPEFGLQIFQAPSGEDIRNIASLIR